MFTAFVGFQGAILYRKWVFHKYTSEVTNNINPDEMAPPGAISSGSMLFANISYSVVRDKCVVRTLSTLFQRIVQALIRMHECAG